MELDVTDRRENKLLDRTEVRFVVRHDGEKTPTRDQVRELLAKQVNAEKERVILAEMATEYGRAATKGAAKVYPSKDKALEIEREHILVRNKLKEKKAKEPKAPAPKKEG